MKFKKGNLSEVEAAKPKDPLTIRKITCKSTGLPVSRVREIKKALRGAYDLEENQPHRGAFERGIKVIQCIIFSEQPEGSDFWWAVEKDTQGVFK